MEKKLVYQSPVAITEIITDEDILTLSGPDLDPAAEPGVIGSTGWRDK